MKISPVAAIITAPLIIAACAFGFIVVRHAHHEKPLISGTVEITHIDVASKIAGRIDSLVVHEGDYVSKGQFLGSLESKEMNAKVEQARGAMNAANAKMTLAKNGLRPQERDAALNQYMQAKAQFDLLDKTFKRIQKLHADSVVSAQEHDQVETQFTAAKEQMEAAKSKWEMAQEGTRAEDRLAAQSLYYQAQNAFGEASAYAQELTLKSPVTGEIEKVISHPGEIIAAGYPIVTIIDTSDVWVVLQVKENAMMQFCKGTVLTGFVPGLGNEMHSFTVTFISPMADFATWRPTNQKGEFDVRTFEIHARPTTQIPGLRAGMTVNFALYLLN